MPVDILVTLMYAPNPDIIELSHKHNTILLSSKLGSKLGQKVVQKQIYRATQQNFYLLTSYSRILKC